MKSSLPGPGPLHTAHGHGTLGPSPSTSKPGSGANSHGAHTDFASSLAALMQGNENMTSTHDTSLAAATRDADLRAADAESAARKHATPSFTHALNAYLNPQQGQAPASPKGESSPPAQHDSKDPALEAGKLGAAANAAEHALTPNKPPGPNAKPAPAADATALAAAHAASHAGTAFGNLTGTTSSNTGSSSTTSHAGKVHSRNAFATSATNSQGRAANDEGTQTKKAVTGVDAAKSSELDAKKDEPSALIANASAGHAAPTQNNATFTLDAPAAPPPALPVSAWQPLTDDALLRGSVAQQGAHMVVNAGDAGSLSLHLRVKDGTTDIKVEGKAAHLLDGKAPELQKVLASEGLSLGHLDVGSQGTSSGQHQDADARAERNQTLTTAAAKQPTVSNSSTTGTTAGARSRRGLVDMKA